MYYTRYRRKRTHQNEKYIMFGGVRTLQLGLEGVDDDVEGVGRQPLEPMGCPTSCAGWNRGYETRDGRWGEVVDFQGEYRSNDPLRDRWGIE